MVLIRPVSKKDTKNILKLFLEVNPNDKIYFEKVKEGIAEGFDGNTYTKPTYLLAELDGKIVGLVGFAPSRINYRIYEGFSLLIDPRHRNKGIGSKLIHASIEEIKKHRRKPQDDYTILTTTLVPNFFKKFGFKTIGKIKVNGSNLMALRV